MDMKKQFALFLFILLPATFIAAARGNERGFGRRIEVVVHRGANHLAPENTVASAFAALEHGADWVEVDVRASKDGVLYNLHDPTLDRTTNGRGFLADMLSADVDRLDAGSWFSPEFRGVRVPRVSEMLDSLRGRARVFFDVKPGAPVAPLIALVHAKGFGSDKSFFWFADTAMLKEFTRLAPEMKVKVNASDVEGIRRWMGVCRPSYVEIAPGRITGEVRDFCRRNGIRIMAAVQGEEEAAYKEAIARQPDLVNLDRPELFAKVMADIDEEERIRRRPLAGYVDPRIGSEGLGRVFVGPSCPFGMAKPSPDCTVHPNSGWLPMPEQVDGFAQVHVSGTGGGPKYGNILVMPFAPAADDTLGSTSRPDRRKTEEIALGYYATELAASGVKAELTAARRASFYRFTYPQGARQGLLVDAGFFLGENPVPDAREAQQFVGSQVRVVSDHEIEGYSRIRGGWNNGRAYTVYFHAVADRPFRRVRTWKGSHVGDAREQFDSGEKTGAIVEFDVRGGNDTVRLKVGISFVSELKARQNCREDIPRWSFDEVRSRLVHEWERLFHRIEIPDDLPDEYKRMFYTALYHTMLMPVDRTGDNPLWTDGEPYYDDFYAIWDTYRTSSPLITLIDPDRQTDIVRALVNIYKRDGYMPDARSGNCNGRTQGGSNAEIVVADAFVKGLRGIDYELALQAMLKDATVPPGGNEEAEGRGGLAPYLQLGYIPHGVARAGSRTVEYSYCDYAIATVARGLGHDSLAAKYLRQSGNWKNLWRADYEHDGARGFIMPRDAEGRWLDDLPFGRSRLQHPTFRYTPLTIEGPWYTAWWDMFFYEGTSWEYSLSIPHDVPGLIAASGGAEAFERRLDRFFDRGYFNVNNEPSFLTPCLYHWLGKPWRSSDRIRAIVDESYSDRPDGLPGNDDSGAMSSWLAFQMIGLYPNAGQDYYLINAPMMERTVLHPRPGATFTIEARELSPRNRYVRSATLNGRPYPYSTLRHADIVAGGELVLEMGSEPGDWGREMFPCNPKTGF